MPAVLLHEMGAQHAICGAQGAADITNNLASGIQGYHMSLMAEQPELSSAGHPLSLAS